MVNLSMVYKGDQTSSLVQVLAFDPNPFLIYVSLAMAAIGITSELLVLFFSMRRFLKK